jgi:hypothetical protein
MESLISDIFDACVFNNIMEDTFIFSPRVFLLPHHHDSNNYIIFNDIDLCEIFAVYTNPFCLLVHNGKAR